MDFFLGIFNHDFVSLAMCFGFSLVIFVLFCLDFKSSHLRYNQIIFTLGVLGTFCGIAWGLYKFNPQNVQDSIPKLLGGLKTAFFTSIFGMLFAIINQFLSKIKNNSEDLHGESEYIPKIYETIKSAVGQVVESIQEGNLEIQNGFKKVNAINEKNYNLLEGVSGQVIKAVQEGNLEIQNGFKEINTMNEKNHNLLEDASGQVIKAVQEGNLEIQNGFKKVNAINEKNYNLLEGASGQVIKAVQEGNLEIQNGFKEINTMNEKNHNLLEGASGQVIKAVQEGNLETQDGFKNVDKLLKGISDDISQGASKAIVEALENSMRNFNENLKESFGENFKQLNNACLEMIKWQDRYKDQVNQGIDNLNALNDTLWQASEAHERIVKNSQESVKVSKKVESLIEGCNGHIEVMSKLLRDYGELSKQAKNMFVTTESGFKEVSSLINKFTEDIQTSIRSQSQSVTNLTKDIEEKLPFALGTLDQRLKDATNRFMEMYEELIRPVKG